MSPSRLHRRSALTVLGTLGLGNAAFRRALAAEAEKQPAVTPEMVVDAEWIAGIELSEQQRGMASDALNDAHGRLEKMRSYRLDHGVAPALVFKPLEDLSAMRSAEDSVRWSEDSPPARPAADEDLAFLPIRELAALIRHRIVSSAELTHLYLSRLKRFDPLLKCVVSLTEDLALKQAAKADQEIAAGHYRGPLHGIPWGAKDLIAYPGYRTTWGAPLGKDQRFDFKAAVAERLDEAGAVLVAKLTLGSYAMGDQWFGGKTRNPWNPAQGSSGSSAGSASAVAAGLVGFSIGSETMGSITSPSKRCGTTGLRPTFGRVSRFGCMTLAWSLDKLGPITRCVEDAAIVLDAIHGRDPRDPSSVQRPFSWPSPRRLSTLRIGYADESDEVQGALRVLRELGCQTIKVKIPQTPHRDMLPMILTAETGSIFDELTRRQEPKGVRHWPKTMVMGQFLTANDYLRANRIRREVMENMHQLMRQVDVLVGPTILVATNMTGHPQVVVPNGFRKVDDLGLQVPNALTFTGRTYDETTLLSVAHAYQQATDSHLKRPPLDQLLTRKDEFHQESDVLDPNMLYQ